MTDTTTLVLLVLAAVVVVAALAVFLLVSVFCPKSWPARFVVDRPVHVPDWLHKVTGRRS